MQNLAAALGRLKDGTGTEGDWRQCALTMAEAGQVSWIEELATFRHQTKGDAATFVYELGVHLLRTGKAEAVRGLADTLAPNSAFKGILLWISGLDRALPLAEAAERLRRGAQHAWTAGQTVFTGDAKLHAMILMEMIVQANLIEAIENGESSPNKIITRFPAHLNGTNQQFILLTACDQAYFNHYAERLAYNFFYLYPDTNLLFLIANPDPSGDTFRAELAERFPGIAYAYCDGPPTAQFYASVRFLAAAEVLAAYARPLVIVDVDSMLRPSFCGILNEALRHSVSFAEIDHELLPSLHISAALVVVQPDETARHFLDLVSTYLAAKFREDFTPWMVDQGALFQAWKRMPEHADIAKLNSLLPQSLRLPTAIDTDHTLDENTRRTPRGLGKLSIHFDEHARPLLSLSGQTTA